MRNGAGAEAGSANSSSDRHPSRPTPSSGPNYLHRPQAHTSRSSAPPPIHKPSSGTGGHVCSQAQLFRRRPVGPSLTDRTSMPTSGPAWPGQEQGDLPRGAAVRACRRQVAWVPPDPARAPQTWGKRIQPAWLVSSNVSL